VVGVEAEQRVVDPVVPVHDPGGPLPGRRTDQRVAELGGCSIENRVAGAHQLPLPCPPPQLSLGVAVGSAEPVEADGAVVDAVQLGKDSDERLDDTGERSVVEALKITARLDAGAIDEMGDGKGSPDHRLVLAQQDRRRNRYVGPGERARHPELPAHVVGRRSSAVTGRHPQHPGSVAVREPDRHVRLP